MRELGLLTGLLGFSTFTFAHRLEAGKPDFGGRFGPDLKVEHLYYDLFPAGVGVTESGRKFSTYPRGDGDYTLAELVGDDKEVAFPSWEMNELPSFTNDSNPGYSPSWDDRLVSAQGITVDAKQRLWVLDTGRAAGGLLQPNGAKLLAFDTSSEAHHEPVEKIIFPPDVAYPTSYLNDVRVDLRPEVAPGGKGIAYITDSSDEGTTGIVVVDIGTGESWRHLELHPSTGPDPDALFSFKGHSIYAISENNKGFWTTGIDGIALSHDGEWIYYTSMTSRKFWRVPTSKLRVKPSGKNSNAAHKASASVEYLGQRGSNCDGLETGSNGLIYLGAPEQDGIQTYDPETGTFSDLLHDNRVFWPDTLSVAQSKLYFVDNQFYLQGRFNSGDDRTKKPYALYSIEIDNEAAHLE